MARAAARHILVETEEQCEDLKSQIEGGADFAEVAQQHSKCPSGQSGGALGEFSPGQMVKEFDDVVFSAEIGKSHLLISPDHAHETHVSNVQPFGHHLGPHQQVVFPAGEPGEDALGRPAAGGHIGIQSRQSDGRRKTPSLS